MVKKCRKYIQYFTKTTAPPHHVLDLYIKKVDNTTFK